MIKLPRIIQSDLSKYHAVAHNQSIRTALNLIASNPDQYSQLFFWLFNADDFNSNQVKFANYIGGSEYEFIDPEYAYTAKSGQVIGYNSMTKQFTIGIRADFIKYNLTRDEILDSPFDINKLIEVPYNGEEKENDN